MEFSNYVESRTPVGTADGTELIPVSKAGSPASMTTQQIADLAGDEHFKGVYANLGALTTAHATANEGDYALVDTGGSEAALYIWDDTDTEWVASGVTTVVPDASETVKGIAEIATQAETNTGTDDARIVTPLKLANYTGVTNKQLLVNSATALTDASSMDLTAIKHTLTTSSATRTFTITYTGDDICIEVTLNTATSTFTFPATSLCVSEGIASGDNTCVLSGSSGDKYIVAIKKVGSAYYVVSKNFGQ